VQSTPRTRSQSTWFFSGAIGIASATAVALLLSLPVIAIGPQPAHAADGSSVTATAKSQDADFENAPMPNLALTVSQTTDLISQGLLISWTNKGGKASTPPSGDTGGENFLQVMQCWGDDPAVPAGKPAQPDRTTCEYGAFLGAGSARDNLVPDDAVAPEDANYTAPGGDFTHPTYTSIPFRSPAGEIIASVVNNKKVDGVNPNTNQFFTAYTSNEVKWAGSSADGSGSIKFEVQTAQQSSGYSCGAPIKATDGTVSGQPCWLVVVPRGTADVGETHVIHSGLFWNAWKHRIAVRIGFKPIGINCPIGAAERQISGSELIAGAVSSWQPALCARTNGSIYTISTGNEADALLAASSPSVPAALALTSRPLATVDGATDRDIYAPVALSGVSISFAIDRKPKATGATPRIIVDQANQAFTSIKLTPRLIAKLLTNSYLDSLPGDKSDVGYRGPSDPGHNARNLTTDPDFLAVNDPEWSYEALTSPSIADIITPQGRSDVALQLWRYVAADKSAAAFLGGKPDQWGMTVNPWNSTAAGNPSGTPLSLPIDNFPKSDPTTLPVGSNGSGEVNLVTWRPYTNDLDQGGYLTLRGDGLVLGPWDQTKQPPAYTKAVRSLSGFQTVLGLTDTASAAKYQTISASLLNPAGQFVSPTSTSMTAAAAAMTVTKNQLQVYEYDPGSAAAAAAPTAYPLTMPVYAATNPAQSDSATRAGFAAFIRYAATTGQMPGTGVGQLPAGYAPLPTGWVTQATTAADSIAAGVAPSTPVTDTGPASGNGQIQSSGSGSSGSSLLGSDASAAVARTTAVTAGPVAAGLSAAPLLGSRTPKDAMAGDLASVVPLSLFAGLLSAGVVPLFTRIRRRT
jgi:hypothetical protein